MIRMAMFREKEREKSACFKDVISVNILIGDASFMGKRLMCLGHKAKAHRHPHFTCLLSSFQGPFSNCFNELSVNLGVCQVIIPNCYNLHFLICLFRL